MANDETGELLLERRLDHQSGEAHAFYRSLQAPVRVGTESTGPSAKSTGGIGRTTRLSYVRGFWPEIRCYGFSFFPPSLN
jgi:hypothetical protein